MSAELMAAVAGAFVGAVLTGILSYLQVRWSRTSSARAEHRAQRLELVREVMRFRLEQERLIGPLNEVPLVFGDDDEVLRLYRATLDAVEDDARAHSLSDLINRLAALVELPSAVRVSDVQRGFAYRG